MSGTARLCHALVALLALAGIACHLAVILTTPAPLPGAALRFASYFTIESNALAAATGAAIARSGGGWAAGASVRGAITLYLLVVALIFHLLLRDMVPPGALGRWGNIFLHQLVPAGWVLCWLVFRPAAPVDPAAPWRWMFYPLGYAGWILILGAIAGWYPYYFINAGLLGYPAVALNILLIGLVFLGLGFGLRWVDGRLRPLLNRHPRAGGDP